LLTVDKECKLTASPKSRHIGRLERVAGFSLNLNCMATADQPEVICCDDRVRRNQQIKRCTYAVWQSARLVIVTSQIQISAMAAGYQRQLSVPSL